jgi:predicted MPP superfamily phosphohydrolase
MWLFRSGFVLLAYILINVYTGIKTLGLLRRFLPGAKAFVFWPVYVIFCYSYILAFLLRLDRLAAVRAIGMYSLPAVVYFFMGMLFFDLIFVISRLVSRFSGRIPPLRGIPAAGLSAAGTAIALGLAVLVIIFGAVNARRIRTVHYEITLNKAGGPGGEAGLPDKAGGLRVALVSDLHIGATVNRKWLSKIVDAVNESGPDIICVAGDVFDTGPDSVPDSEGIIAELKRFSAPLGVYACQGNHDLDRLSPRGESATDRIRDFLGRADIIFLFDEVELVAGRFYLAGRRDASGRGAAQPRKSAAELAAGLDKSLPLIFMDHQPTDYKRVEEAGADLIFSGHTHRGQFFPGNIATARIFRAAGAAHYGYWRGDSAQAVISSGAGVWGPPIRVLTGSEAVIVDITFD